jgi:hypothetical protein
MEVDGQVDEQGRIEFLANATLVYENGILVALNNEPFDAVIAVQTVREDRLSTCHENAKS